MYAAAGCSAAAPRCPGAPENRQICLCIARVCWLSCCASGILQLALLLLGVPKLRAFEHVLVPCVNMYGTAQVCWLSCSACGMLQLAAQLLCRGVPEQPANHVVCALYPPGADKQLVIPAWTQQFEG